MKKPEQSKSKRLAAGALAALFWIALWYACAALVNKSVLVASPAEVWSALVSMASGADFWASAGASLLRTLAGWSAGAVFGVLCAVCARRFAPRAVISPMMSVIRATPVASFILLAIVWLRVGDVPPFISFLMVSPVVYGAVSGGLDAVPRELAEVARVYEMPLSGRLSRLYIPALAPYLLSSLVTSLGLAWKAGVAAEVLCRPPLSIGKGLYDAKIYLETPQLFAWTLVVVLLSLVMEKLLAAALAAVTKHTKGGVVREKTAAGK